MMHSLPGMAELSLLDWFSSRTTIGLGQRPKQERLNVSSLRLFNETGRQMRTTKFQTGTAAYSTGTFDRSSREAQKAPILQVNDFINTVGSRWGWPELRYDHMGPPLSLLPVSPMTGSHYSKIRKYRRKSRRLRLGERLTKIMAGAPPAGDLHSPPRFEISDREPDP